MRPAEFEWHDCIAPIPKGACTGFRRGKRRIPCLSNWALQDVAEVSSLSYSEGTRGETTTQPARSCRCEYWFKPIQRYWRTWLHWLPKETVSKNSEHLSTRLYLFSCGVMWHKQRDASPGWELIQFLRSQDKGTRAIAAALLAKTEPARLWVRDLRRARIHVAKPVSYQQYGLSRWAGAQQGG